MHLMQKFRGAVWAGIIIALPCAAQQITLRVNPQQVNVSPTQTISPQTIRIERLDSPATVVPSFRVTNPVDTAGGQTLPYLELIRAADNVACDPCQAPGDFKVRYYPGRVTTFAPVQGYIQIGGTVNGVPTNITATTITVNLTGTGIITATPSGLTFTQTDVGPKLITLSSGGLAFPSYTTAVTYVTGTAANWLVVNPTPGFPSTNPSISVTVNPAAVPAGTHQANLLITRSGSLTPDQTIPITLTVAGNVISVSPTPPVGLSTATPTRVVTIGLPPSVSFPYTLRSSNGNQLVAFGDSSTLTNNSVITLVAVNPAATPANTQVTLEIIPGAGSGYTTLTVPVVINPTTGARSFSVFPTQVSLTQFAPSGSVTVTPSVAETVPVTVSLSANLQQLQAQGLFQVFPAAATQVNPGGTTFQFAMTNTSFIPANTIGSVTITPTTTSGYGPITIPIYLNGTGTGGIGSGSLNISPTAITVDATSGSTTTTTRSLAVTSTDLLNPQSFTASASTTTGSNWLSVSPTFSTTPTTLTITIDSSQLQAGTYTGSVVVTPYTGVSAGFPTSIPVTVTVTSSFTVSFNPSAVAVTAPSSGPAATSTVQVNLASGSGNPAFTTSVNTDNNANWLTVTSSSSTLPATLTISANPVGLTPGFNYSGRVNILSGTTTVGSIPVVLTVTAPATLTVAPATLAFAHQTTSTSNPVAQTVQVTSTGASANWSAIATSAGNWLQVSPATGSTPGALTVSVNPTGLSAGTYNGTISVSSPNASNSPQTINVGLTVTTPAIPQPSSVVNAASSAPTVAVPGMIFTILGTDLGGSTPSEAVVSGGAIATTLGGVRVLFDGIPAPLLYVSANQINGVMPYELYGRFSTRMQVEARNQRSREVELRVADSSPGIFTLNSAGSGQGAILNQNGTVNGPANPADRGSVIVIYATGHGQTNPPSVTGRIATGIATPLAIPVRVTIGGQEAEVLYAGPAPGLISGATQVNAMVPTNAPTGSVPVTLQVGGAASQANVTVSIR